ncbi:MAG: flagellar assembly protein FliX [Pseudomonadota bacterium]|nr:flagellar assembly protein FliX [Pseudomonadota bacterium]
MDINGTRRVDSANVRRGGKIATPGSGSTFTVATGDAPRAQSVTGPGPIAALDSILALQEVNDSTSGRSKGLTRGNQLLDMLDELRDGLLGGGVHRATLNRLANAVGQRQDHFSDPRLQSILDEIELRAHVELAKLEQADLAAA